VDISVIKKCGMRTNYDLFPDEVCAAALAPPDAVEITGQPVLPRVLDRRGDLVIPLRHDDFQYAAHRPLCISRQIQPLAQLDLRDQQKIGTVVTPRPARSNSTRTGSHCRSASCAFHKSLGWLVLAVQAAM
jgi:hypothetical protein